MKKSFTEGDSSSPAKELQALARKIIASKACPRLSAYCREVAKKKRRMFRNEKYWGKAVPGFGDPRAELLILGLAPAAHGANRTGRMFTGDRSGDFLIRALHEAGFANQPTSVHRTDGLKLRNCYITSLVHWAPPKNKPTPTEIRASLPFLEEELRLQRNVKVILALGRVAFESYLRLMKTIRKLSATPHFRFFHGASYRLPEGLPRLFCSYHPSQQNTQTGKLNSAMFQKVLAEIQQYLAAEKDAGKQHEALMVRAIQLAKRAGQSGDAPVGSLVVLDGKIVSQGMEAVRSQRDISAHAELVAIRNACKQLRTFDLSGCALYTTAEPCFMCSYAIRQTQISQVVLGAEIQHKGGITSHHPILIDPAITGWSEPPTLVQGVLRKECQALQKKLPPRIRQAGD